MDYHYPIDMDWSKDEIMDVITFFNAIESYYEQHIAREVLMARYRRFKAVVPGKADEKRIFEDFRKHSGYDSYFVMKQAKEKPDQEILSNK